MSVAMAPRSRTGVEYEQLVGGLIRQKGLIPIPQVDIGKRPDGRQHRADFVVATENGEVIVSCKVQHTKGTAEEKLPFEVLKLVYALETNPQYRHAYLVLGGGGWDERLLGFIRKELPNYLRGADRVAVKTTLEFAELPTL